MNTADILGCTTVVLLDFDGPVTPLMAPPAGTEATNAARAALLGEHVTPDPATMITTDHLAVLRWAGAHAPDALPAVEQACDAAETRAALVCEPTPGAHDLLTACDRAGRPVVIVSNNAAPAIDVYLDRWGVTPLVRAAAGRPPGRPDLMKPNPYIITTALRLVSAEPDDAVLIGDTITDVHVAKTTGVRSIGYAKTTTRGAEFTAAGADAITEQISTLAAAINGPTTAPPH